MVPSKLKNHAANRTFGLIALLTLSILSLQVCVAQSATSTVQDRALAYIETVLPLDTDKFGIELKIDGYAEDIPVELDTHNVSFDGADKVLIYFLGSRVGTMDWLDIVFAVKDNVVYQCAVDLKTAPDVGQSGIYDAVTIFLSRYQTYSGLDSTHMIDMLKDTGLTQNTSVTAENLTLTIQHISTPESITEFRWAYPNGSDYVVFDVSFQNNFPISFHDERLVQILDYTITPSPSTKPTAATDSSEDNWSPCNLAIAVIIVAATASAVGAAVAIKRRHQKTTL